MIAANGVTARFLDRHGLPSLRRVVRTPEALGRIVELAAELGETPARGARRRAPSTSSWSSGGSRTRSASPSCRCRSSSCWGRASTPSIRRAAIRRGTSGWRSRTTPTPRRPTAAIPDLITQRLLKAALRRRAVPYSDRRAGGARRALHRSRRTPPTRSSGRCASPRRRCCSSDRIGEQLRRHRHRRLRQGHLGAHRFTPLVEGRLERGFEGLDVGDRRAGRLRLHRRRARLHRFRPGASWPSRILSVRLRPRRLLRLPHSPAPLRGAGGVLARTWRRPAPAATPRPLERALAADRERLRARLAALAARPEVLEAVFLASPSLSRGAGRSGAPQPDGKKGQRAERALVRYVYRMAARATPFGLFSGCSLGRSSGTRLRPPASPWRPAPPTSGTPGWTWTTSSPSARTSGGTRPCARPSSTAPTPASTAPPAGCATPRRGWRTRSAPTTWWRWSLGLPGGGAAPRRGGRPRAATIADALVAFDPDGEVTPEEAAEYVTELIDSQILVSDLSTPVTGPEAIHELIAAARAPLPADGRGRSAAERAGAGARDELAALDAAGPGEEPGALPRPWPRRCASCPTSVEMSRLFQLDMVKPADEAVLGARRAGGDRAAPSSSLLPPRRERPRRSWTRSARTSPSATRGARCRCSRRWTRRWASASSAPPTPAPRPLPCCGGSPSAAPRPSRRVPWGRAQGVLLAKVTEALADGRRGRSSSPPRTSSAWRPPTPAGAPPSPPLPDAFHVMATVAAASPEALDARRVPAPLRERRRPLGSAAAGPLLPRRPGALPPASRSTCAPRRRTAPDAIFAEIVHLPQGRIGNILARPVLREYEIPFLGRSGAPPEQADPGHRPAGLRRRQPHRACARARLGREVIPRLTSAHNFWRGSLGVYRFLCMLQGQGVARRRELELGALDERPVPAPRHRGRLVLSRASWWMTGGRDQGARRGEGRRALRGRAAPGAEARRSRASSPWSDADNELLVDLDNVLSSTPSSTWSRSATGRRLVEFFPGPDELCATRPRGALPPRDPGALRAQAARRRPRPARPPGRRAARRCRAPALRALLPARLRVALRQALHRHLDGRRPAARGGGAGGPRGAGHGRGRRLVLHPLRRSGLAPAPALPRRPGRLARQVAARACTPRWIRWLADGRLWKVQLDTYEREVERYGGPEGMLLSERLFHADSEAVLAIVEMLEGDEGADVRWRLALRGIDMLLTDLGLERRGADAHAARMKECFAREFGGGKGLRVQLDQRFRKEGRSLVPLLDPAGRRRTNDLAPALAVLRRRSERSPRSCAELRRAGGGRPAQPCRSPTWPPASSTCTSTG